MHCHSTHSDGTKTVEQILTKAEALGIKALCISDHDNIKGSLEAVQIGKKLFSGELIMGIEISTIVGSQKIHLLAHFPSHEFPEDSKLLASLRKIQSSRVWRMKEMVKKARGRGWDITYNEVEDESSLTDDGSKTDVVVISRPHLARVMIKKGIVNSLDEAFDKYLGEAKPIHVERFSLSFEKWIEQVHEHHGLVTWAHPLEGHKGKLESVKDVAAKLVDKINGIEIFYRYDGKYKVPKQLQKEGTSFLETLIDQYGLLRTAGGDYHEDNVGFLGGVDLPEEDWVKFKNKLFGTQ